MNKLANTVVMGKIEEKDFRIGNYVQGIDTVDEIKYEEICEVIGLDKTEGGELLGAPVIYQILDKEKETNFDIEFCEIKLLYIREDLLIRLGFSTLQKNIFEKGRIRIEYSFNDGYSLWFKTSPITSEWIKDIKYVHELQNTFKEIEGEELILRS